MESRQPKKKMVEWAESNASGKGRVQFRFAGLVDQPTKILGLSYPFDSLRQMRNTNPVPEEQLPSCCPKEGVERQRRGRFASHSDGEVSPKLAAPNAVAQPDVKPTTNGHVH